MIESNNYSQKRKFVRFKPHASTMAILSFAKDLGTYTPEIYGLVINEGYMGCGAVMLKHHALQVATECIIKCGDLDPLKATVRWINELDDDVIKIGFQYSDER